MADPAAPTSPPRLAFALGEMTQELKTHTAEQERQRQAIEALPGKISAEFGPRLANHEGRLIVLEGDKRFVKGVLWVLAAGVTIIGGRAFIH